MSDQDSSIVSHAETLNLVQNEQEVVREKSKYRFRDKMIVHRLIHDV